MARFENLSVNVERVNEASIKTLKLGGDPLEGTASTTVTSTAAEMNLLDAQCANAVFTVGAEAANEINVAIQLNDAAGTAMAVKSGLRMYLSSDAAGVTIEGSGPDSWAIGTDGILIRDGGDSLISGFLISEADGDIDIDLTHVGADTFYMNVVLPNGSIVTSGAITFDATT